MYFRDHIHTLAKRWRIIAATTAIIFLSTLVFVSLQDKIYEATTTYIMKPHSSFTENEIFVRSLDTLSRRDEINGTYVAVVGSKAISNRSAEKLGLSPDIRQTLSANGRIIAGTNVLEITVRGPEPLLVRNFANAVGAETASYLSNLYNVFELQPLDAPVIPTIPVEPRIGLFLFGAVFLGLALGAGLVFTVDDWTENLDRSALPEVIDYETGLHNRAYFMLRLKEEISKARPSNFTFALALVEFNFSACSSVESSMYKVEVLRRCVSFVGSRLREEDIMIRFDETKLALILMDYDEMLARNLIEELKGSMVSQSPIGVIRDEYLGLRISAGMVAFQNGSHTEEDALLDHAECALKKALDVGGGKVILYSDADTGVESAQELVEV